MNKKISKQRFQNNNNDNTSSSRLLLQKSRLKSSNLDLNSSHLAMKKNKSYIYNENLHPSTEYNNNQVSSQIQDNKQNKQTYNKKNIVVYCPNHPKKEATYEINNDNDQQIIYCQKCAILLASQGFKVKKITTNLSLKQNPIEHPQKKCNQSRKAELQSLHKYLQTFNKDLKIRKQSLEKLLIESQNQFNTHIEQISQYFEQIYSYLEEIKNKYYMQILQEKSSSESITLQFIQIINQFQIQLETMIVDVQINQPTIYQINKSAFSSVVTFYNERLIKFEKIFNDWSIEEISIKKIPFENLQSIKNNIDLIFLPVLSEQYTNKKLGKAGKKIYFSFNGEEIEEEKQQLNTQDQQSEIQLLESSIRLI